MVNSQYAPLQCWEGQHIWIAAAGVCGLLVYSFGYPLLVWRVLYRINARLLHSDAQMLQKWGFLYDKYEPQALMYELVLLARRCTHAHTYACTHAHTHM